MAPPRSETDTPSKRPATLALSKRFTRCTIVIAVAFSVFVTWTSPSVSTLCWLGGALLLLFLALGLQRFASRTRVSSLHVSPAMVLSTVTTCGVLLMFELGLRLFAFQSFPDFNRVTRPNLGYEYDPLVGWRPAPNSQKSFETGERTILITNNSKGLRDIEPIVDRRPGVVFLGDSFVWGYNLEANERFSDKLRARHPDWRVYNAGVVGYGTDQEFLLLQQWFDAWRPRLVVLIFCTENDHVDNSGNGRSDWVFKPYYTAGPGGLRLRGVPVPRSDWVFCREHPWLSKPYLVRLTMRAWGNLRSPTPRSRNDPTHEILRALNQYVSDRGARLCVGLTRYDADVECFLTDSKIPFVDLTTDLVLPGDWHWSANGNTFVADKLDQFIQSNHLFP